MSKFKTEYTLPIIMRDRHRIGDLEEIKESIDEREYPARSTEGQAAALSSFALEEYIENLQLISGSFLTNITNNIARGKGIEARVDAKRSAEEMIDKIAVLGYADGNYNCHGWSLGAVHTIQLHANRAEFLEQVSNEVWKKRFLNDIDYNITAAFTDLEGLKSLKDIPLSVVTSYQKNEGSIVTYSGTNGMISHTAKYVKNVRWYNYEEAYSEWYAMDRGAVKFDDSDSQSCIVENYTSKLGLGHLVSHNIGDLVPLYGEVSGYFDFS
jgi:hypothetical protein